MTSHKIDITNDRRGTTKMRQEVTISFHNGFRDDINLLVIESDVCYILAELFECDDWTGEVGDRVATSMLTDEAIDTLIDALTKAKHHREMQRKITERCKEKSQRIHPPG